MGKSAANKLFCSGNGNIPAFLLGGIAGASLMLIGVFLYLRYNLLVRYDFPGVTMPEMDAMVETAIPRATGWTATQEVCSLPMASSGRVVHNWKLCNRRYAQILLDSEYGMSIAALLPCTVSITQDENDGHAIVSRVNTHLLGILFGGDARDVFRNHIDAEQDALIRSLAEHSKLPPEEQTENEQP